MRSIDFCHAMLSFENVLPDGYWRCPRRSSAVDHFPVESFLRSLGDLRWSTLPFDDN